MAAKAQCCGAVAPAGEEVQKMLVPAPRCDGSAVDEQQRRWMRVGDRPLVDDFEHRSAPLIKIAPKEW